MARTKTTKTKSRTVLIRGWGQGSIANAETTSNDRGWQVITGTVGAVGQNARGAVDQIKVHWTDASEFHLNHGATFTRAVGSKTFYAKIDGRRFRLVQVSR